jgi:hypothetical protein
VASAERGDPGQGNMGVQVYINSTSDWGLGPTELRLGEGWKMDLASTN